MRTYGILGLGLIGGSFARALKCADPGATEHGESSEEYGGVAYTVYGSDLDARTVQFAQLAGAIDGDLTAERIPECDCLFLCVPTMAACRWLEENAPRISKSCMVIDCCGVKRVICEKGFALAKRYGFEFVGGHPMAGTQHWGFKNSRADMYRGASFIVVPPRFDDIMLLERIKGFVKPAGFARMAICTAEEHDKRIAFSSQLAHVVSNAYIKTPTAREHSGFSAGSYRDLTRVAWLNPPMWAELFMENRDNLLRELDTLMAELAKYRAALADGDQKRMAELLDEGRRIKEEVDG